MKSRVWNSELSFFRGRSVWLSLLGLEEGSCFRNLFSEFLEVLQVSLDFLKRQINQHTGDLRGVVFSSDLLNKLKDEFSNLGLVMRVSHGNSGNEHETFLAISLFG